jgi:transmembrane sensor
MLTQPEYEALLDRYLAGTCSPTEQHLVEQWYQQLGQDELPRLSAAEQEELRTAIWDRIESLTHPAENNC